MKLQHLRMVWLQLMSFQSHSMLSFPLLSSHHREGLPCLTFCHAMHISPISCSRLHALDAAEFLSVQLYRCLAACVLLKSLLKGINASRLLGGPAKQTVSCRNSPSLGCLVARTSKAGSMGFALGHSGLPKV